MLYKTYPMNHVIYFEAWACEFYLSVFLGNICSEYTSFLPHSHNSRVFLPNFMLTKMQLVEALTVKFLRIRGNLGIKYKKYITES